MRLKGTITRRSFVAGATLGAVSIGARLPSLEAFADPAETELAAEETAIRLHRNESPYGMPPASVEAVRNTVQKMSSLYPIEEPVLLAEAIAKRFGVHKDQVILGCGSIEVLKMATEAFCSPSRFAVVAEPTYEAVASFCPFVHAKANKVPLTRDEHKHNLSSMLQTARQGAGMVFLCNPSNPAGSYVGKEAVERFVRHLPRRAVLLSDEAYGDYVDQPDFESCLRYVHEGLPVVVSRTFSKVYGMAGLRVGYAIGRKDLIKRMAERRLANNPNQLAVAAALAALKDPDFAVRVRKLNAEAREFLCSELQKMRLEYIPSQTNFVMIEIGRPAKPVIEALKERKVQVGRLFPSMPSHLRVSLGTVDELRRFLKVFREVMSVQPE